MKMIHYYFLCTISNKALQIELTTFKKGVALSYIFIKIIIVMSNPISFVPQRYNLSFGAYL